MADISLDYLRPAIEHDPRRAVNAGIMEQTAVGIAAGFALEGFHPIVHTLAPFLTERRSSRSKSTSATRGSAARSSRPALAVRLRRVRRDPPRSGDIQVLGSIPGLEVLVPGSAPETDALLRASYANGRPTYLRHERPENRDPVEPAAGGLTVVRRGDELTVIAAGPFLSRALDAFDGVDATVLYATTLVPLDAGTLAARPRRRSSWSSPRTKDLRRADRGGALAPADAAALDRRAAAVHRALRDERRA